MTSLNGAFISYVIPPQRQLPFNNVVFIQVQPCQRKVCTIQRLHLRDQYEDGFKGIDLQSHLLESPVFDTQAGYSFKFINIIGNKDKTCSTGMTRNHLVIRSYWCSCTGQFCTDLPKMYLSTIKTHLVELPVVPAPS